jgi:hypothetical protein
MGYLDDLQKGIHLFPPEHILYHYTTFRLLAILKFVLPHAQDYYLVETLDAFWGCLGLTVIYRIFLNRMSMARSEAFLGTAVVAFSFGMWFYSSNIEVYMPPLFFLLYGLYLCTGEPLQPKGVILLIVVHCLAVLFHQSNVLFTPIVLWKCWDSRKNIPFARSFAIYAVVALVCVAGFYFAIGWWVEGQNTPAGFSKWLRGYTTDDNNYWLALGAGSFLKVAIGWGHAFFGGHFIFRIPFLKAFMDHTFYYHSLDDEAYLVRNLNPTVAVGLLTLTLLVVAIILALLTRVIRNWKTLYAQKRRVMIPLLMFLVIYFCFFLFWIPENLEFWIPQTGICWVFLLGMNKQLGSPFGLKSNYPLYAGLTVILLIVNYEGSIRWMKDINNDSVYAKIVNVKETATDKDIVILRDPWLLEDFLRQYSKAEIWNVPTKEKDILELNHKVDLSLTQGGRIFLFTQAASIHSIPNDKYLDSLIANPNVKAMDFPNELTPVKMLSAR